MLLKMPVHFVLSIFIGLFDFITVVVDLSYGSSLWSGFVLYVEMLKN